MAKRFTDTEKWKKPFLRSLKGAYKLLWFYICDDCDHAGIWQVDMDVARIRIGEKLLNEEKAVKALREKIIVFDSGKKWFIPSFIEFQYPKGLNPSNQAHGSVINILSKYNLINEDYEPLMSPSQGAKDKDMDMVKDKELDQDKGPVVLEKVIVKKFPEHFSEGFNAEWEKWKEYKLKEHKFGYKSEHSEKGAITELMNLAKKDEISAKLIIEKSISSGWKGFWKSDDVQETINAVQKSLKAIPAVDKRANELEQLYRQFQRNECSIISIDESHYLYLKKAGRMKFDQARVVSIQKKALEEINTRKLEPTELESKKFSQKIAVIEFFNDLKETGAEAVFHAQN